MTEERLEIHWNDGYPPLPENAVPTQAEIAAASKELLEDNPRKIPKKMNAEMDESWKEGA